MPSETYAAAPHAAPATGFARLKRTFAYAKWIYLPFHSLSAKGIYDLFGTDVLTDEGLFLNMGYWPKSSTMDEACRAMVDLVGERAALGPGDRVLDVGFGFGEQDMQWMRRFEPAKIVGVNITESQVAIARRRVEEEGFADRIDLRVGSATELPFEDASFDKVIALECAQHFDTREQFFREAFRVLRPGGRLVTADILPLESKRPTWLGRAAAAWMWKQYARMWVVPKANHLTRDAYAAQLASIGFERADVESIRDDVYPKYHEFLRRPRFLDRYDPVLRAWVAAMLTVSAEDTYAGHDYVIAVAHKPG